LVTAGDELQPLSDATKRRSAASHEWRTSILGKDRKSIIEIDHQFPTAELKIGFNVVSEGMASSELRFWRD